MAWVWIEDNPDWDSNPLRLDDLLPDVEYWEAEEEVQFLNEIGCEYCGNPETRDNPEPFGNRSCCEVCFAGLIGDDDLPNVPWRCGRTNLSLIPTVGTNRPGARSNTSSP